MQSNQSNRYQVKENPRKRQRFNYSRKAVQNGPEHGPLPDLDLNLVLKQLVYKLHKVYVAIKYQFYRITAGFFDGLSLPWLKLGVVALAVFILIKKDIQFSINMKAPLAAGLEEGYSHQDAATDELGFVQSVAMRSSTSRSAAALPSVEELNEAKVKAYIKRFSRVASAEMEKYGIPASIKMAQGILESHAGTLPASAQNNNHFGVPLAGKSYNSAWENWRTHSLLIKDKFSDLFQHGTSYRKWANALASVPYNRDKHYAKKLIDLIEKYQLYLLDEI